MPHSRFLDEWNEDDKAKVLAYMYEESLRCDMCGTSSWEWEDNPHAYTPVDKFCKGCYIKSAASDEKDVLPGTTVTLRPLSESDKARMSIAAEKKAKRYRRDKEEETRQHR